MTEQVGMNKHLTASIK